MTSVNVNFASYSNGPVPSVFTNFENVGTAPTISSGLLTVTTGASTNQYLRYNAATTTTDYQQVTGTWSTLTAGSGDARPELFARLGTAGNTYVSAVYESVSTPAGWYLFSYVSNSLIFEIYFADTFTTGAAYTLVCGDSTTANAYKFQVLKNGTPLALSSVKAGDSSQPVGQLYYLDTANGSTVGASNRYCGLGVNIGAGTSSTIAMSSFAFADPAPSAHYYLQFLKSLVTGRANLEADSLKVMLVSSSYTPNQAGDTWASTPGAFEITGTGYTAGGAAYAPSSSDAADVLALVGTALWPTLTATTPRWAVIYDASPGSYAADPLIGYLDLVAAQSLNGVAFQVDVTLDFTAV